MSGISTNRTNISLPTEVSADILQKTQEQSAITQAIAALNAAVVDAQEAVDAAGEDVGPNAHGSDRRGSVQRDRLRCSQSGLQSHYS